MPLTFLLKFRCEEPIEVKSLYPKTVHGLFFSILGQEVGELFHKGSLKPFSLFFRDFFKEPEEGKAASFTLELNLLDDSLYPKLARELTFFAMERSPEVTGVPVNLVWFKVIRGTTYEELHSLPQERDFTLRFLTPTSFKKGDADYPLPVPELVVKSLLRKWNRFSPYKFEPKELIDYAKNFLAPSGCWIRTKKFEISEKAKAVGFTGQTFFYSLKRTPLNGQLHSLFKFASYAGVGRKTTMGMGKCLLLSTPEDKGSGAEEEKPLKEEEQ